MRRHLKPKRSRYVRHLKLETLESRDVPATVWISSVPDDTAAEPGTDTASFVLSRDGATAGELTVQLAASGTATAEIDYELSANGLPVLWNTQSGTMSAMTPGPGVAYITFPAGADTVTLTLTALDDTETEGTESATLQVADPGDGSYTVGTPASTTIYIEDDEVSPTGDLQVQAFNDANESGVWDANEYGVSGVGWSYAGLDPGNSGVSGNLSTDVDGLASATLVVGDYSYDVTLPDAYDILTPFALFGEFSITEGQTTTMLLPLVDVRPVVSIEADATSVNEGSNTSFSVSRTGDLSQPLTVQFAVGGTANEGTDFQSIPHEVTIPSDAASTTVNIVTVDDNWDEEDETIAIGLLSTEDYQIGVASWSSTTIVDQGGDTETEPPPVVIVTPTVSISISQSTFSESDLAGPMLLISREGVFESELTVPLDIGGSAINGADYELPNEIVIPAGETDTSVSLEAIDDDLIEGTETITISLIDTGAYYLGNDFVSATLLDDVTDGLPVVTFETPELYVEEPLLLEPPAIASLTLHRTGPTSEELTVDYGISGTAENGTDYLLLSGQAVFSPGSATTTIDVLVVADEIFDDLEDVILTLQPGGTTYAVGPVGVGVIRIIDQAVTAAATVTVTSVEFKDALDLRLDIGNTVPRPQWKSQGNIYPVAYPQNQPPNAADPIDTIKVKVTVKLSNPAAFKNKTIKLMGVRVVNFQGQEIWYTEFEAKDAQTVAADPTIRIVDDWISLDNIRGDLGVGFYDRTFNWVYAVDPTPETEYKPAGQSTVPWYSTFMAPAGDVKLYRTVVHLGCISYYTGEVPARTPGMTDAEYDAALRAAEASLRGAIWNAEGGFASRQIKTYAGNKLYYYKKWTEKDFTDAKLLSTFDAQCSAWAMLFRDVMRAQGFDYYDLAKITAKNPSEFFMVKNWNFPAGAGPFTNTVGLNQSDKLMFKSTDGVFAYNILTGSQVTDANGIPGQNTENPASLFQNHVVLGIVEVVNNRKVVNRLYDPSYGSIYEAGNGIGNYVDAMETAAIAGFYTLDPIPGDTSRVKMTIRKSTGSGGINVKPYTVN